MCCECGSSIDPGEKYYRFTGIWDGEIATWKTCVVCQDVRDEAYVQGLECICFGDLWETVGSEFECAYAA